MTPRVTLYTRAGCCLCDTARERLAVLGRRAAFTLEQIDIDTDRALRSLYNDEIPVVAINGRKAFKYHIDEGEFLKILRARA